MSGPEDFQQNNEHGGYPIYMQLERRPWGVHRIGDIYGHGNSAGLPDGRYVHAVACPYYGNRLRAAWWVLTGRANAVIWPEDGELEQALSPRLVRP
jgi:hypothetical protein